MNSCECLMSVPEQLHWPVSMSELLQHWPVFMSELLL